LSLFPPQALDFSATTYGKSDTTLVWVKMLTGLEIENKELKR
jgi:hypothetical protein